MNNNEIPKSVENLAKRLWTMARQYDGISIVQVTFVANGDGTPVFWTRPVVTPLEPRLEMDIISLEKKLGREELQRILQIITMDI